MAQAGPPGDIPEGGTVIRDDSTSTSKSQMTAHVPSLPFKTTYWDKI